MKRKSPATNVERGEFPFPILEGAEESRYLTWIRNHSNYMAVRGFLDYVRAISVLLRGIVINFLVLLPYLLIASLVVAWRYLFLEPSFDFTVVVLICAGIAVLLFPLLTPHFKILRHRRRLSTGSDSSVWLRDLYERSFGAILLAIVGLAAFESLAVFLPDFHRLVQEGELGAVQFASITGAAVAAVTVADKLLSMLAGIAKKLALVAIGALGLLVPLLVILIGADFLVFGLPSRDWSDWNFVAFLVFILVIGVAFALGVATLSFTWKDFGKMALLLIAAVGLGIPLVALDEKAWEKLEAFEQQLHATLDELHRSPDLRPKQREEVARLVEDAARRPGPELRELLEDLRLAREYVAQEPAQLDAPPSTGELEALAAYAAFLPDIGYLIGEIEKLEPRGNEALAQEIQKLLATMSAVPLGRFFVADDPTVLVRALIEVPHENILVLTGQAAPYGDPALFLEAESPPIAGYATEVLNYLGTQLLEARKEIAVRANYSRSLYRELYKTAAAEQAYLSSFMVKSIFLAILVGFLLVLTWLTVDVNLTSIHGLYRDRLASAFLVGVDTKGDVDIEKDLDLGEICRHEAGSTAPYHLINVALNLQGSKDIGIRDRKSDFFVFSKRFIGGERTRYCRSDNMEMVFPQMDLATAMAISAAAASPNMGKFTSPALTGIMTLLNVRLGYWIPNPRQLESWLRKQTKRRGGKAGGYTFPEVFEEELEQVTRRWEQLGNGADRQLSGEALNRGRPAPEHGLVGIGFSGGGIRSATLNLGIAQALHRRGVFGHIDYMSTVSGGGYLGSSVSALMREKTPTVSEIGGWVRIEEDPEGHKIVSIERRKQSAASGSNGKGREYRYGSRAELAVRNGMRVRAGQRLIRAGPPPTQGVNSLGAQFHWRVRPGALLREVLGRLDETHRWVNVSDGGHIENLAGIELLRRRCKYVILGDGEADPLHYFGGLATLIRAARIDLGIRIEIDLDPLRLGADGRTRRHWVVGQIHYPRDRQRQPEPGHLLYLKASVTGDEDEVIQQYRHASAAFPHESTADQFFSEGQFEAYRSLGQHIAEEALMAARDGEMSFADLGDWFRELHGQTGGSA